MVLKIMTLDGTDLIRYDKKTGEIVPSNISKDYEYVDKDTGEILQLPKKNLFKMRLEDSMALDEFLRIIEQRRLKKEALFKVHYKEATNYIIHVTFKYSKIRTSDNKDKFKLEGLNKKKIRDKLYDEGFDMDGIHYVRWIRSGSTARVGNCLFIKEDFLKAMSKFTDCDIKIINKLNLASFEAYRALLLSSKIDDLEIRPENILLIKDVTSTFNDTVMYTGEEDKKLFTEKRKIRITNKIHDGQSLMDKSLFGKYKNKGMLLLRHKFFKSCCFNANIQKWFKDNSISEISQLNGLTVATKIEDIKLITTPSSIKYCKFGKKEKWFYDWLKSVEKSKKPFGVVKYEKPTKYFGGQLVRTHYQILNTLQIVGDNIKKLLQPTLDYLELLKTDYIAMYHYCEAHSDDEDSDLKMNVKADIIYRMMKLNENFHKTALYKEIAKKILEDIRSDIKCGRILVKGNYSTIVGNPIEMLQEAIGCYVPESTVIGEGNIISTAFEEKELLVCRSPHVCAGNIYLPKNLHDIDLGYGKHLTDYINLTDNIVVINSVGENTLQRLSGCDMDSDQVMIVDNDIMLNAAKKNYKRFEVPTTDIEPDPLEQDYTPENLSKLDYDTSENLIGEIVNLSQVLNSIYWNELNSEKLDEEYLEEIYKDICQLSIMSGLEIDKAKKTLIVNNKDELDTIRKKYRNENGKIEYPKFFHELNRDSKKTYVKYQTTLDMIGEEIAYMELVIDNDGNAFDSIITKPNVRRDDAHEDKIKAIKKICSERRKADAKLRKVKEKQGKSEYIKQREIMVEDFIDDMSDYKNLDIATLYFLIKEIDKKDSYYLLQGLLEVDCKNLKRLVEIDGKTPTYIEHKDGDVEIYGLKHKREVA